MTTHSDRWLTIRQAAQELNVSELTIRRRIKDGKLTSRLRDGKYYVKLDAGQRAASHRRTADQSSQPGGPAAGASAPDNGGVARALPAIDLAAILPQVAQLAEDAGRAAILRDQVQQLEVRVSQLQQGTVALASRNGWLESKLEERERELKLLTDQRPKRPWWRRILKST